MSLVTICRAHSPTTRCRVHDYPAERRCALASMIVDAIHCSAASLLICRDCVTLIHSDIQQRHTGCVTKLTRLEKELGYRIV